jgi:hypothetical protein
VSPAPEHPPLFVFAQTTEARIDLAAWNAQARRFFRTRLELAEDPGAGPVSAPWSAAATLVVAHGARPARTVRIRARAATSEDRALAEELDAGAGGTGLALVARRCPVIWELARTEAGDAAALRLAAVLASALLGPVLDPLGRELFGVRTARAKLEAAGDGD